MSSLSLSSSFHSLTVFLRDDPYMTTISSNNISLAFNVYDIITGYENATIQEGADCIAAYYLMNMLICQAQNSTESTEFSNDGNGITSSCL